MVFFSPSRKMTVHYIHIDARFQIFAVVKIKVEVFLVVTPPFRRAMLLPSSGQQGTPKCWCPTATLHGVTTQETSTWKYIHIGIDHLLPNPYPLTIHLSSNFNQRYITSTDDAVSLSNLTNGRNVILIDSVVQLFYCWKYDSVLILVFVTT